MSKVLVAGATGYLGGFVVKALKVRGYWVRALSRSAAKLDSLNELVDEVFVGEVTKPNSLNGLCNDIDVVFSSIGITRQKEGFTFWDVDYQGNKNLLHTAQEAGVSKFVYVHILNAQQLQHVVGVRAKQAFVDDLKRSGQDYTVVCPTGFFSDIREFLEMARSGRVYLLGEGRSRINPIDGADLAEVCVDAIDGSEQRIDVGGPEVLTYAQIAELAFDALSKPPKITRVPNWLVKAGVQVLRWLTSVKTYGPVEFFASVMTMDMVGEPHGVRHLDEFYRNRASRNENDST
jgi:uncharacterized protein YbjT (DUF2867 family)